MNRLEVRKTLVEAGIQASGNQIDRAIEALNLPEELQLEHVDRLKAHFQATTRPNKNDRQPHSTSASSASNGAGQADPVQPDSAPANPIAPHQVKATQAQESAAKMLELAVQAKAEGLNEAAQRGATQAIEEVTTEFTAYANVLFQGTEAMTQAKAALREGLKQATTQETVAVDFSDFFHLNAAAPRAIEGGN